MVFSLFLLLTFVRLSEYLMIFFDIFIERPAFVQSNVNVSQYPIINFHQPLKFCYAVALCFKGGMKITAQFKFINGIGQASFAPGVDMVNPTIEFLNFCLIALKEILLLSFTNV